MRLAGAVCLVTGGSSGIGRAAARLLVQAGARVAVSGRDEERLAAAAAESGGTAIAADLAVPGGAERLAREASSRLGRVDVLVNNAGAGVYGPLAGLDADELERLVRLNLIAPMELTRALLPGMIERRRGHVVNVGSIAGHVGVPLEAVYAASKGGLTVFSESLRQELAGSGVGVSLVSPGVVDTAFFERRGAPYARGWPRPITAEAVARTIVDAVARDRALVVVPAWMTVPARMHGALPGLYRALAERFGGS